MINHERGDMWEPSEEQNKTIVGRQGGGGSLYWVDALSLKEGEWLIDAIISLAVHL